MPRSRNEPQASPVGRATLIDGRLLQAWPLPVPPSDGDKEGRGRVLIVGGARQMPGAVMLAATAALRAGAGKLQIATVGSTATAVAVAIPESFVHALPESPDGGLSRAAASALRTISKSARAIVLGPGMIENRALAPIVLAVLANLDEDKTVVLDAGALTILAQERHRIPKLTCSLVITPHAGEMAKLLGIAKEDVKKEAHLVARRAANELQAITVLKGAETFVSDGTKSYRNVAGNSGLATSGSGDTLSGLIGGLVARGATALQAAVWGVHLHARAGEQLAKKLAPLGYLPRELLHEVPALMAGYARGPRGRRSGR